MKKNIALIVAIIALGGGAFLTQQWFVESLAIDDPSQASTSDSATFSATSSSTVLDAMRALSAEGSFSFSGRVFPGLGFFVEEINGKKSDNGYYWILYVNGTSSQAGASQTILSAGDRVEWKYGKGY